MRDEYPLNPVALQAELGIGDSYFENEQYVDAEVAYGSFVELHPTNPNVPYAMFQLGMCHYHQMQTIDRDQTETQKARKEFERLIARFPQSKFAIMAEKNLREVKQRQAEHEFYIGEFYYRTKKYEAALKRFESIQRDYANLGLDYKTNRYIEETKQRLKEEGGPEGERGAKGRGGEKSQRGQGSPESPGAANSRLTPAPASFSGPPRRFLPPQATCPRQDDAFRESRRSSRNPFFVPGKSPIARPRYLPLRRASNSAAFR